MKIPKCVRIATTLALLSGCAGCSTLPKTDLEEFQGTWQGREMNGRTEGVCRLIITGEAVEFRGANTNEWYMGTFSLRQDTTPSQVIAAITQCSFQQYMGKIVHGIYRLDGHALTYTANEPGNPEVPLAFDSLGSRRFELRKQ